MKRGRVAVISGPSGVGQDTVIDMFQAKHPDWWLDVSVTTREPRPGEVPDKDMIFVTPKQFQAWQIQEKFLEVLQVVDHWYGTLRKPVEDHLAAGTNVFIRPHPEGVASIKRVYPDVVTIFLTAESWQALEARLRDRHTEDEAEIERRLAENKQRLTYQHLYDHVIINPTGHPEQAVTELEHILGY